jgi:hypothetical protein
MEGSPKRFLMVNFIIQTSGKTKNKMGGHRLVGHITDPRNTRMEETSRRERRMTASSKGSQGPEGTVVPQMDDWKIRKFPNSSNEKCCLTSNHTPN